MDSQAVRVIRERLWVLLAVVACGALLRHFGLARDLQDFALIVTLCLLAPVWLVVRLRSARSPVRRWLIAAAFWCGLWAAPLLWKRPWDAALVVEVLGRPFNWWRTVAPDLLPFFILPLVTLLLVTLLTPAIKARETAAR
jgi:hypothetical protein